MTDFATPSVLRPYAANSVWKSRPSYVELGSYVIPDNTTTNYKPEVQQGSLSLHVTTTTGSDAAQVIYARDGSTLKFHEPAAGGATNVASYNIPRFPAAALITQGTSGSLLATGDDGHFCFVDHVTQKVWGFWRLWRNTALNRMEANVITVLPLNGTGLGAGERATFVQALAGLIRVDEVDDGEPYYHHPLALCLDFTGLSPTPPGYKFPASSADTDYASTNTGQVLEGSLMFLPKSHDVSIYNPRLQKVARTLQMYGGYVVDRNGGTPLVIYAEIGCPDIVEYPAGYTTMVTLKNALRVVTAASGWRDANNDTFTPATLPVPPITQVASEYMFGSSSGTFPYTRGLTFGKGLVPAGKYAVLDGGGSITPITTWNDGSLKLARAVGTVTISGGSGHITASLSSSAGPSPISGTFPTVVVTHSVYGTSTITGQSQAVGTDTILKVRRENLVYFSSTSGSFRLVLENSALRTTGGGPRNGVVTVSIGGTVVSTQTINLPARQNENIGVFFFGVTDPQLVPAINKAALEELGMPHFATTSIDESILATMPRTVPNGYPGDGSNLMADGGEQERIGFLPNSATTAIVSNDKRAIVDALRMGVCAGHWPMLYRDETTGYPLNIAAYPTLSSNASSTNDYPAEVDSTGTINNPDIAHHPAEAVLPWLLTADPYYLDLMLFWSVFVYIGNVDTVRLGTKGLLLPEAGFPQVRGVAWGLRSLYYSVSFIPDGHPCKAGFVNQAEQNIAFLKARYVDGTFDETVMQYPYPTGTFKNNLGMYDRQSSYSNDGNYSIGVVMAAGWMNSWIVAAQGLGWDLDMPISGTAKSNLLALRDWGYQYSVGINGPAATSGQMDYRRGAGFYGAPVGVSTTGTDITWNTNWGQGLAQYETYRGLAPLPSTDDHIVRKHDENNAATDWFHTFYGNATPALGYAWKHNAPGAAAAAARVFSSTSYTTYGNATKDAAPQWNILTDVGTPASISAPPPYVPPAPPPAPPPVTPPPVTPPSPPPVPPTPVPPTPPTPTPPTPPAPVPPTPPTPPAPTPPPPETPVGVPPPAVVIGSGLHRFFAEMLHSNGNGVFGSTSSYSYGTANQMFINNFSTGVIGRVQPTDTTITLAPNQAWRLGNVNAGNYYLATLTDFTGANTEIVKVIGVSGDALTVVRGQENTTPRHYEFSTANLSMRVTAGTLSRLLSLIGTGGVDLEAISNEVGNAVLNNFSNDTEGYGDALVTVKQPFTGAQARTQHDKNIDTLSVLDFMSAAQIVDIRSNNATIDVSANFQDAINAASAAGGRVFVPAGSYLLNSAVNVNSADVAIEGAGEEITKLLVNNTTGGILFNQTNRVTCAYTSRLTSLTIVAVGAGNVLRGKAWSIVYAAGSAAPATPNVFVSDVNVRSASYDAGPTQPRFSTCGYVANGHNVQIDRFSVNQGSNDDSEGLFLDYDATAPGYRVAIRGVNLQGNRYGIKQRGAVENLIIDDYEIAVPRYGMDLDASAVVGRQTPLLTIGKGHVNSTNCSIHVKNWVSVKITQPNVALYTGATTSDADIRGVFLENCTFIEYLGSDINSLGAGATSTTLLALRNCAQGTISGLIGQLVYSSTGNMYGVTVDSLSNRIKFDNCGIDCLGGQGNSAFRIENGSNGLLDQISITGCTGNGFLNGAQLVGAAGTIVRNNDFNGCGIPVQIAGARYATTIIEGNLPVNPRVNMSGATPSVGSLPDGRIRIVNTSPTTITNFTNAHDGQEIDLYFGDGNTTVASNTAIFLQGSTSQAFAISTILKLKFDATAGIWYEIGRRT